MILLALTVGYSRMAIFGFPILIRSAAWNKIVFFQQASRIGLTHADVLKYIVHRACDRYQIPFPLSEKSPHQNENRCMFYLEAIRPSDKSLS